MEGIVGTTSVGVVDAVGFALLAGVVGVVGAADDATGSTVGC